METEQKETAIFDLDLPDHELIQIIKKPINDSKKFWNGKAKDDGFDLEARRKRNRRLWKGDHYEGIDMYDHEVPYTDNVIFPSVESATPIAISQIPQLQVMPAGDSISQVQLARDLDKVVRRWAETQEFVDKMAVGIGDGLLEYGATFKLRWNEDLAQNGEVEFIHVLPEDVIVDHNARMFENPRFVAHRQFATVQELMFKFPDKEEEIKAHFEIKQARTTQMTALQEHWEVWFTYYDDDGTPQEGVAWLLDFDMVLGKMTNPNWVEQKENGKRMNYLDAPTKPFFFMNVYNSGKHKIDDNAAIDQAYHQQKIVNKRGRQIVENADQSGSGIVYNTAMIGKEDMAKLIGAPDEKVGVNGDVNRAFARMSPPLLPGYVIDDKFDARDRIQNYFGANDVTQGRGNAGTATQDVLQAEKDTTRQSAVVRGVERVSRQIFRYYMQMVKVNYTEKHYFVVTGANGQFDKISMESDDIEDGIDIKIVSGSTLPVDQATNRAIAESAAPNGFIDPLTYWEVMQTGVLPQPQVIVERLVDWTADQGKFVQSAVDEEFNREAMTDIKILNAGKKPKVRSEPSAQYLDFRKKYMASGDFIDLPRKIQQAHVDNLQENVKNAQRILSLMETQLLTEGQDPNLPLQQPVDPMQALLAQAQGGQPQQQPQAPAAPAQNALIG